MNSDEDTRRETSPEIVNEYIPQRGHRYYSIEAIGRRIVKVLDAGLSRSIFYRFFIGRFCAIAHNVYMRKEKKREGKKRFIDRITN